MFFARQKTRGLYSLTGAAVSNRIKKNLAIHALKMAINLSQPPKGCIHHTDRRNQYCAHDYLKLLKRYGFKVSMSREGNCWDNAVVERFFKTVKAELVWRQPWHARRRCEMALFHYIKGFYNPRRRHSALGFKNPVTFERNAA